MITEDLKKQIIAALEKDRELFSGSDAKYAVSLGINSAQYSRIKRGDTERVLSEPQWITLARRLEVSAGEHVAWNTAETYIWTFIQTQLLDCQKHHLSRILCDEAGIGKSYAARRYAKTHTNAAYVNCVLNRSRPQFIRAIAKAFGVNYKQYSIDDVFKDLTYNIGTLQDPLIIIDEAGALDNKAWTALHGLWEATEHICGFFMMGADGFRAKLQRGLSKHADDYAEIFDRFGGDPVKPLTDDAEAMKSRMWRCGLDIIKANPREWLKTEKDANALLRKVVGHKGFVSLRQLYTELNKTRPTNPNNN
jgi:hypothetical protein